MIANEIIELDTYWEDLLFRVTKGSANEINSLKKYNIFDFFAYLNNAMKKE
jgi:hypothetical protein